MRPLPLPLRCVVSLTRYNRRIKTYMRDVNAVKKMSSDTGRASSCFDRALHSFWPSDKAAHMRTLLLEDPDSAASDTLKSSSRYEEFVSFRQLVTGAVCAWQECWSLLQTVKSKIMSQDPYIDRMTESLVKLKTDLIGEIDRRHYREVVMCVFSLLSAYLQLQARRMKIFIKNPRLLSILDEMCSSSSEPLVRYTAPTRLLEERNERLKCNFRIYQRDNIEDFLVHLEEYFQPKMKNFLEKKTWLICEQGQSAAVKY